MMSRTHPGRRRLTLPGVIPPVIIVTLLAAASVSLWAAEPIDVGSRLELLLDDYLIESMESLQFHLHRPRPAEKVLAFDKPWDNPCCDYVTVFQDGDLYRMYYASHLEAPGNFGGENQAACYAQSKDAIHWTKPSLGLIEFEGSKDNSIVWRGQSCHNFTPFIDTRPGVPADQRYKAVGGCPKPELFASADGLRWRKVGEVGIPGGWDSQNVMFWDTLQKQYMFYFRIGEKGVRHIALSTSADFLTWTKGQSIDLGDSPREHLYTNATIPYFRAPHVYLAFPMRYVTTRAPLEPVSRSGVCDGVFMFSRDGLHFSRRYMEGYLRPGPEGRNWNKHSIMQAWGLLPTAEDEITIYYSEHFWFKTAHLRRAVLRTDGFVSLRGGYSGGEFVTKPIVFSGRSLVINADTSAAGGVRVEIQGADGKPVEGYRLEDCTEFYGDKIAHTVKWKGGSDLGSLAGKPVRLRMRISDADLYSFRFVAE